MVKDREILKLDNIEKYIASAAVLRKHLLESRELKDKFAKFTYLFPTLEDKIICKAIFDTKYISDVKCRKFISRIVDGLNAMNPQNISEMINTYNQISVIVSERMKKQEQGTDDNGSQDWQEEKQGSSEIEDKQTTKTDVFSAVSVNSYNEELKKDKNKKNKKEGVIVSLVPKDEIARLKDLTAQKELAKKTADEKLQRYEESLRERARVKKLASAAPQLQQMRSKYDD